MDLVVNHTSDEHAWFAESRKSKDNPYRDYYFGRIQRRTVQSRTIGDRSFQGRHGRSMSGQDSIIFTTFEKQPDLNWENEAVRREVYDLMTFGWTEAWTAGGWT
ncbi:alpha-amylase family glycosyl hydrolase [Bacillus licheniformis]|nr:alpha-amylase family glycosyl hydrolase [Bacillus licheniformis]